MKRLARIVTAVVDPSIAWVADPGATGWPPGVRELEGTDPYTILHLRSVGADGYGNDRLAMLDRFLSDSNYQWLLHNGDLLLVFRGGDRLGIVTLDGSNEFVVPRGPYFYDLDDPDGIAELERKAPGLLDIVLRAGTMETDVDWRPDETIPEDYYSS